ncbi:glycosyltransferase family 31 protein [Sclerotinia borealis F-4128]|uniref:Glycosyltransferase family 31 protein n=1 Tax=Sclerotinia borealis (strain F-4128) TaxID=1432307 RepID=W9CPM3_SCLBF|nr:glycosyltransferase family 31 protein [Sclerotinia borealis F-4128]
MKSRRPFLLAVSSIIVTAIILVARHGSSDTVPYFGSPATLKKTFGYQQTGADDGWVEDNWKENAAATESAQNCHVIENLEWLDKYNLSYPLKVAHRDIIAKPNDGARPLITTMDESLFDNQKVFQRGELSVDRVVDRCFPLTLEVPYPPSHQIDASHMIFGLQTTMKRLRDTKQHLARWLPNSGARLFAIVKENEEKPASKSDMALLQKDYRKAGMDVTIIPPVKKGDFFNQRYFSLINVMYAARNKQTKWTVIMDDDTFFPSFRALLDELAHHDHTQPQYIGGLSEDWAAVRMYGLMAFGGAGVFLSTPLAKIVHDNNNECKNNMRFTSGDTLVMDCIARHSTAQLKPIAGLSQIDLTGDHSGFYENGRRILSLHHWKAGSVTKYPYEMDKMHLVSDVCDECFLQRWQFKNDIVLTNGFSIAKYSEGSLERGAKKSSNSTALDDGSVDLRRTEVTWDKNIDVMHSLAPTRPALNEEQKLSWNFLDSFLIENGNVVRQVYLRRGIKGEGEMGKKSDEVLILDWKQAKSITGKDMK